jgi:hypothetical protein
MSDDLCYLTATEAAALFRARKLSPVELLSAQIARAEAVEPEINAFTYRYFDDAMAAAKKAEARFMKPGARPRALEGLSVAIKDAGHLKGKPTSAGSLTSDEAPQPATSPINDRVLRAGAIAHARSATPEFSCASVTHSRRWGVTRNPWAPALTPGGSSGGAGASLAAGTSTLATGSDIGGSIRIPAACCGLVGYKPPRGRNPIDAPFNLDFYCHTGPLARSVGDAMLLQNVMSGPHPLDPTMLPGRLTLRDRDRDLRGWRITDNDSLSATDEGVLIFGTHPALTHIPRGTTIRVNITPNTTANAVPPDDIANWDHRLVFHTGNATLDATTDPGFAIGPVDNLVLLAPGHAPTQPNGYVIAFWSSSPAVTPASFGILTAEVQERGVRKQDHLILNP